MEDEVHYYKSVPEVKSPSLGIIAVVAIRSDMDTSHYWKTCRLYRLPMNTKQHFDVLPERWDYIAPQKKGSGHYGLFPIMEETVLPRSEIIKIYKEKGIPINEKPTCAQDKYWLFRLGEPIPAPPDLNRLHRGRIVNVVTRTV